ncbi:MAG: DUF3857 and transglutaminase domain-containing protein [Acidobacteriales bacterium]|nr:DUF3857 and transglutaminase domain-containing protein [Terriglobales bacterium]
MLLNRSLAFPSSVRLLACACFVALLSPSALAEKKPVLPDWLKEAAKQPLPSYPANTNAVVLLSDTTYTVGGDLRAVEHQRLAIKILRPQGRRYARLGASYDGDSKIRSLKIWSIGSDGREYELKDNEITDGAVYDGVSLYSDNRHRQGTAPAADPGAIVAMEYEQEARPYSTEYIWELQQEIPVLKERLKVELPPGVDYKEVWKGKKETTPVDLEKGKYLWEVSNEPPVDLRDVNMAPEWRGQTKRMSVHYFGAPIPNATKGSWESIGEWYDVLAKGRNNATPELTAKAQELIAGKTDFAEKVQAIGEYVQSQVRYVAIEIGVGGYQPHPAQQIYKNKYGDCKDKATLLSAMLSSVGIRSTWVMVDSDRGVVDPNAPSIAGNHMIAAIELPAGYESPKLHAIVKANSGKRFLIFDPTWEYTPFGHLEYNLQGGYGVLMDGKDSQVIAFPILSPEANSIRRTGQFKLAEDGSLNGQMVESRFGDIADRHRRLFRTGTEKEQREIFDRMLGRDLVNFSYDGLKVENAMELTKDLKMSYALKASSFARPAGSLLMMRPRVLGTDTLETDKKTRVYPIDLGAAREVKDDYEIELPAGYVADELPDPVKIDMGWASYESASKVEGDKLHYTRTYVVRQVELPAEKYEEVQKLAGVIGYDEQSNVVLKKK